MQENQENKPMQEKKEPTKEELTQRVSILEMQVEHLLLKQEEQRVKQYLPEQQKINREKFAQLYNYVKYDLPIQRQIIPMVIWLNSKYKDDLVSNFLYPAEETDCFYIKGEFSPLLIGFKNNLDVDYRVDMTMLDNFF